MIYSVTTSTLNKSEKSTIKSCVSAELVKTSGDALVELAESELKDVLGGSGQISTHKHIAGVKYE